MAVYVTHRPCYATLLSDEVNAGHLADMEAVWIDASISGGDFEWEPVLLRYIGRRPLRTWVRLKVRFEIDISMGAEGKYSASWELEGHDEDVGDSSEATLPWGSQTLEMSRFVTLWPGDVIRAFFEQESGVNMRATARLEVQTTGFGPYAESDIGEEE